MIPVPHPGRRVRGEPDPALARRLQRWLDRDAGSRCPERDSQHGMPVQASGDAPEEALPEQPRVTLAVEMPTGVQTDCRPVSGPRGAA